MNAFPSFLRSGARRAALPALMMTLAMLTGCMHGPGMHGAMHGGGGGCCGMMAGGPGAAGQGMSCHGPEHARHHGAMPMRSGMADAAGLPPAQPGGRLMPPAQMAAAGPMCGGGAGSAGGCCCCGGGMANPSPATGTR